MSTVEAIHPAPQWASMPPSTTEAAPVTYEDSSIATKKPHGVGDFARTGHGSKGNRWLGCRIQRARHHRRQDGIRVHGVHPDPILRLFDGADLRYTPGCEFGCGVGEVEPGQHNVPGPTGARSVVNNNQALASVSATGPRLGVHYYTNRADEVFGVTSTAARAITTI
jgi:hypothetical protein